MAHRYFRLRTLGQLSLTTVDGESETMPDARPRHLAVLTVLALASRPVARDTLVEMFWGGESEERARHSLSNALSALRSLIGPDAVTPRRDAVALSDELRLEVDALQFEAACGMKNDALAATLYGGPFLPGVHVSDAPGFDAWLSRERTRLERLFLQMCERALPPLVLAERWKEAGDLAQHWLDAAPDSVPARTALARARTETERRLADVVAAIPTAIPRDERPASAAAPDLTPARPNTPPIVRAPVAQRRARRVRVIAAGVVLVIAGSAWMAWHSRASAAESRRPIVAVTAVADVRGDSTITWLRAGLPRIIASELDAIGGVEVVAPSRVRDVVVRLAGPGVPSLSEAQSADAARRVGATWVVTGGLSTANAGYLLDITARNIARPDEAESFTLFAADPIELGKNAASRLALLLAVTPAANGAGARYSGIGTSNPDAYRHYVRGLLAADAERLSDAVREFDLAIAQDSEFVDAMRAHRDVSGWMGDDSASAHFARLADRYAARLPELERLRDDVADADSLGETTRADALSASLVERFAHDPRAYSTRADLLINHGRWFAADSVLVRELALDSLAMSAGSGPCTPCAVFVRLSQTRLAEGNPVGAEAAARRWVELQPDFPAAWRNLAATLAAVGRSAESVDAGRHMLALSKAVPAVVDFGRIMLSARRYDIVDSLLAAWHGTSNPLLASGARDLRATLERERGQFIASGDALSGAAAATSGMSFVLADNMARTGRLTEARRIWEQIGHPSSAGRSAQFTAPEARGFSWAHALEADALVRAADTAAARPLVDSLMRVGAQSYYGRDRLLFHHVRGMLDLANGNLADAERELRAAQWNAAAWTRSNVELARVELARGHAGDAVVTLRNAYLAPLDGMGRYVPHSELDWWMARAFAQAAQTDSASVYARYVRAAWAHADPAVRARMDSLPP